MNQAYPTYGEIKVCNGYGNADTTAVRLTPPVDIPAPKVSVIMPVYNASRYLRQCLESVCRQTLEELEIICVDDGSTDDSMDIILSMAAQDPRIILLSQKNSYAGVARNVGIAIARGEFLSFLDADDYFEPEMLEEACNAGIRDGADIVGFGFKEVDDSTGEVINTVPVAPGYIARSPLSPDSIRHSIYRINSGAPWSKLFRRSLVQEKRVFFVNTPSSNDFTFVYTMFPLAGKITLLDGCYVYYRVNQKNNISAKRRQNFKAHVQALMALRDNLEAYGLSGRYSFAFERHAITTCARELKFSNGKEEMDGKLQLLEEMMGPALTRKVRAFATSKLGKMYRRLVWNLRCTLHI